MVEAADESPIGPRLTGIVLLGSDAPVTADAGVRIVDLALPRANSLVTKLTGLLGRPLSRRLIADIVSAVTRSYRAADRPFVSVTTPPQDLTAGVLRLRVVEFVAGRVATRASPEADGADVASRVRFRPGMPIDAGRLRQDLGWLDHDPFRRVGAIFSSGAEPGTTDLTLNVVSERPWQVSAGLASSDAPSSGELRVFAGIVAGDMWGRGRTVSAQATASGLDDPRYWSFATRLVEPFGPRRELSVLVGHVQGRRTLIPFASRADTTEAALFLRFALPPVLLGDAHLGIRAGHQRVEARFGGLPLYDVKATRLVAVARYSVAVPVASGLVSADVAFHASPGGLGRANSAARLFFGRPRAGSATYGYLTADFAIDQVLAGVLIWRARMMLQAAAAPLPGLDQIGLGGSAYVRGYTLDDGGYDSAVILRNALGPRAWRSSPYLFTDWGHGRDVAARRTVRIGSIGAGITQAFGSRLRILAEAALPLLDSPRTAAWSPRIIARGDVTF